MYTDEDYVIQAIQTGVSGYLHKQTAASTLIKAVRAVVLRLVCTCKKL
ncbi:MAG: hypothetical protein CMG29_00025 [Candidatus Marinimicrobia bacterium]|jgi:DNA-binding NarL/FixJ family response regulator|nr:hypothetical protein [Candidatus Neomarinimicrobiota bacterium]